MVPQLEKSELLEISSGGMEYRYHWHCGYYWSKFLKGLRDEMTIYGIKCPTCGKIYIPPREVCGPCFVKMNEWVDLGTTGNIIGFTVVRYPYIDPSTGKLPKVPFTTAFIRVNGADTNMMHYIEETNEKKIVVGMKVEAVFRDKRTGTIHDIEHFRLIT